MTLGGRYVKNNNLTDAEALSRLGSMIRSKRLALNTSQEELAKHIGCSTKTVNRLESGEPISSKNLLRVMRGLEMLPGLLSLYEEPELSLEEKYSLIEKKEKKKRKRASKTKSSAQR